MSAASTVPDLSIGELSARLGVSAHTLRERAGLLAVPRTGSGVRRYSAREVEVLRFLLALRSTGLPIAAIRRYVELAQAGEQTAPDCRALLVQHRQDVQGRLQALTADLGAIERRIEWYDRQLPGSSKERL
ncbi:MerR family transcriptional regulator [Deinococcus sp.]|uniref:MerR family transcriptional regulator n=1 Tax=Deinococcus sp. TaxID=47478 RepID=UPI0025E07CB7|nr:MerR family transcriptional regulator [Deinococcus sp.]